MRCHVPEFGTDTQREETDHYNDGRRFQMVIAIFGENCTGKTNIAYCGLDCGKCDAYLATIHNDPLLREKTAKLWSELNQTPISPEDIHCLGCRGDGAKTVFCENLCSIRRCAMQKGMATCGDCPELEQCESVGSILRNNPEAQKNLKD